MLPLTFTATLFLIINQVICGVLILTPKPYDHTTLKPFDENSFDHLKSTFKNAKFQVFHVNSDKLPGDCSSLVSEAKFTSYIPNIDYVPEDVIMVDDCTNIKKQLDILNLSSSKDKVLLIIHNRVNKVKRDAVAVADAIAVADADDPSTLSTSTTASSLLISSTTTNTPTTMPTEESNIKTSKYVSPDEPVIYYPEDKKKALLYSARALLLTENNTSYNLGAASFISVDERDNYSRMSCTIPFESKKITLRFRFPKENGYWYLTVVEVDFPELRRSINLTITKEVSAPMGFSYRCGGDTVFSDPSGSTTLTLYDLQVEPRVESRRFSDAFNCVPFMTGPIWSGIFVSSLLCIGLIVGLAALGSIKTMDKFDNSKTKQLSITIMGE